MGQWKYLLIQQNIFLGVTALKKKNPEKNTDVQGVYKILETFQCLTTQKIIKINLN